MRAKIAVIACSVVLLLALGSLWLRFRSQAVRIPRNELVGVNTGFGQVLGEETAKVVPSHGRVVLAVLFSLDDLKLRMKYQWNAFERELQKKNISIIAAPVARNAWNTGSMSDDQAAFKQFLEQHADADAIVFFAELPEWGIVGKGVPEQGVPKLIAIDHLAQRMKGRYRGYFDRGILLALIGIRTTPVPASAPPPRTPREWFDFRYQVYTPANYDALLQ